METNEKINEINRLNFEDFLWIIFAILCFLNVYGDYNEKEYLKTNSNIFKNKSNYIFELTITVTLFIYIYFFIRNYKFYQKSEDKNLYSVKVFGSIFLIVGIICLLYFQNKQTSFIGSPGL